MSRSGDPHPSHGWKLRYTNRDTGRIFLDPGGFHAMAACGIHRQQAPQHRRRGYCVVEGKGGVHVGAAHSEFAAHDVFVVPSWETYRFSAATECVIFSYSDRAAQEALASGGKKADSHPPLHVRVDVVRPAVDVVEELGHPDIPSGG